MRPNHITVCVCTFKRPDLLLRSLQGLGNQTMENNLSYSIVVADNDQEKSAEGIVHQFSTTSRVPVTYCVEPQQNIALVRNKAISQADGEFIAFIDDDEVPPEEWLLRLHGACQSFGSAGVLGPVIPYFDSAPPSWVTKGEFFDRPRHSTGYKLNWTECRTGNVLFRRSILPSLEEPFRSQFNTAGEDMDFFRRTINNGSIFKWCSEAPVYELVPPSRCNRTFLMKRALLRGSNFPKHPADRVKNLVKSIAAVPAYALALPVLALCGHHIFLRYLIKLLDHISRLLAFSGFAVVKERET